MKCRCSSSACLTADALERAPACWKPGPLLALIALDLFLDLSLYGFKVKARRRLHRREVDGGLRQSGDLLLNKHEPPEFAAHEIIHVASARIVQALTADGWRSLERVLADIDNG